ncbi:hypothetical protein G9P44_004548 [Scheffersomyces stipitis]|nr:hypothetical protein G9P44_004548 [Scheffersomyces stipitis]
MGSRRNESDISAGSNLEPESLTVSSENLAISSSEDQKIDIGATQPKTKKRKYSRRKPADVPLTGEARNRKAGQATRTLKACELCRKQKTRCFRSPENKACLRCTFLSKSCSFEVTLESLPLTPSNSSSINTLLSDQAETNRKLDLIYSGLREVLHHIKGPEKSDSNSNSHSHSHPHLHSTPGLINNDDARLLLETASSMKKSSIPNTPSLQFIENLYPSKMGLIQNTPNFGEFHDYDQDQEQEEDDEDEDTNVDSQFSFQTPTASSKMSPFSIVNNQLKPVDVPRPILNLLNLSTITGNRGRNSYFESTDDLLTLGILSESETVDLMNDFRRNYGRWVSFPSNLSTSVLIDRIRHKSSLLLTTCCCISLRYSLNSNNSNDKENLQRMKKSYRDLVKQLIRDLDRSLIKFGAFQGASDLGGDIEFLQAMVILSIYSFSISSIVPSTINEASLIEDESDLNLRDFNLDPWFLSSIGLTTFITKSTFGTLFKSNKKGIPSKSTVGKKSFPFTILYDELDSDEYQTLTTLRIYNHMCLVHLIQCVFSGRMCVLDEIRINYCTATLSLPSATNFDGRMVSEIGILLIAYNYMQILSMTDSGSLSECESNFLSVKEEIGQWYEQWEYLFSQPALQFVELNYNFCNLIIHYGYTYQKMSIMKPLNKENSPDNGGDLLATAPMYEERNISYILENSDRNSLSKMFHHSYNVVKFVNDIESDSYFAYLSDQLHFCFYFSGICLVNILRYVIDNGQLNVLGGSEVSEIVKDIRNLIDKFSRVGQDNQDDIITKYKIGLENHLSEYLS